MPHDEDLQRRITHNQASSDGKSLEELVTEAIVRGMSRALEAKGLNKTVVVDPGFIDSVREMIADEGGYIDPVYIEEAFANPEYMGSAAGGE